MEGVGKKMRLVGMGEALFDLFGDQEVMGGAPLNMAFHARQLTQLAHEVKTFPDASVAVVSSIGRDRLGDAIASQLVAHGVETDWLQRHPELPTGTVRVELAAGEPTYTIVEGVAWDHLVWDHPLQRLAESCSGVCFGTLAQRHPASRLTISHFLESARHAHRLLDINLRPPFIDTPSLRFSCQHATLLKCNSAELKLLMQVFDCVMPEDREGLERSEDLPSPWLAAVQQLMEKLPAESLLVTRGALGCTLIDRKTYCSSSPVTLDRQPDADSVGAGDATAATFLAGVLGGWSPARIVAVANWYGAWVASRRGATPSLDASARTALTALLLQNV
ncbi:MAG: PfkB family carbohydrate kinase [Pirellulaceae bacterium]|jgi:fructokinase